MKYRDLKDGEIIEEGDEWERDGKWSRFYGMIGSKFSKEIYYPSRRPIPAPPTHSPSPYDVMIGGVKADPYRILDAYGITHPAQQHAIKKLLRAGRSHKDLRKDISEVIDSLNRWVEMIDE